MHRAKLARHRRLALGDFDDYADKDALRQALAAEQHGLCCYCMDRIRPELGSMKIEHWQSQTHYLDRQLDYGNLLGACLGGEGQPAHKQHCDTRKGNRDLKWNPATALHKIEDCLCYEPDGSIRAHDVDFDRQINDILNLNLPVLKSNRKGVLDALLRWWKYEKARLRGPVPRERLVRKRDEHASGDGELKPFCQVAVWWLDRRLQRMAA